MGSLPEELKVVAFQPGGTLLYSPTALSLIGRVIGLTSFEDVWIRLTGVYLNVQLEVPISSAGAFSVPKVPNGAYLLLVLRGHELLKSEPIQLRYRASTQRTQISVGP